MKRFIELANAINEELGEGPERWYSPAVKINGRSTAPRGKLYQYYKGFLKIWKEVGLLACKARST